MPGMDAIVLLENLGVKEKQLAWVKTQSSGSGYKKNTTITLELL
jgi:hypothetical protein